MRHNEVPSSANFRLTIKVPCRQKIGVVHADRSADYSQDSPGGVAQLSVVYSV